MNHPDVRDPFYSILAVAAMTVFCLVAFTPPGAGADAASTVVASQVPVEQEAAPASAAAAPADMALASRSVTRVVR